MLKSLYLKNYILIEETFIPFYEGLTILTGETGSGKSILLDALKLLLGHRADPSVIRDTSQKCIIEGVFSNLPNEIYQILKENDIDLQDELIIRREIKYNGTSRAFINDTPANLSLLKEIGEHLIDIHSQHQTLFLSHPEFQIRLLDSIANQTDVLNEYQSQYQLWIKLKRELNDLINNSSKQDEDVDYIAFLLDELVKAKLSTEEFKELEHNIQLLEQSENIRNILEEIKYGLSEKDQSVLTFFKNTIHALEQISNFFPSFNDDIQRLRSIEIELKEFNYTIHKILDKIHSNPDQLESLQQRMHEYQRLLFKHKKNTVEELFSLKNELEIKLKQAEEKQIKIENLQKQIDQLYQTLLKYASQLSQKRMKVCEQVEKNIIKTLQHLGMTRANFSIQIKPAKNIDRYGMDEVVFLFDANGTGKLEPLSEVASGGEISRLMLALKAHILNNSLMPTIFFDEIDTGVSGEIAAKVGDMLQSISKHHQLFVITHLPQVASRGDKHIEVIKKEDSNGSISEFIYVEGEKRVEALARLLANKGISKKTMEMARELLNM
ncbi:MAG: DNA repair protein RecN [Bacteroidales bacterium]|nr:DNA repair protein RecN [Bacteroidales bacterium]